MTGWQRLLTVRKLQSVAEKTLIPLHPDGHEARVVMQQSAEEVDQARCSSSHFVSPDGGASYLLVGSQLRKSLRKWLSPPDPSTNHNIACGAHLNGTAKWLLQGSIFQKWKSSSSLLWIHGKRMFLNCYPYHIP